MCPESSGETGRDALWRDRFHSTYVQKVGTGGFFAVCSGCGWLHPEDRDLLAEAEADAQAHGPLSHIYDDLAHGE